MSKQNIANHDVVETTRLLTTYTSDPAPIIKNMCKSHELTAEFVDEFRQYITEEDFTTSYKLQKELADQYPELFKKELLIEKLNNGDLNLGNLSLTMFLDIKDDDRLLYEELVDKDDDYETPFVSGVMSIIRQARQEELDPDLVLNLLGIHNKIDELLLKRIQDQEIRNNILLLLSTRDGAGMSASSYKYLSNDMKESLIGEELVEPKNFINALSNNKDLGWQISMINKAVNGEITFNKTTATLDNELVQLFIMLPENEIAKFTKLAPSMPNAFSYKLLEWVLNNKNLSEDNIIEMIPLFKQAGLYFTIKKLAKQNNYTKLLEALK